MQFTDYIKKGLERQRTIKPREKMMKHYQVIIYGDTRGDHYELKKYNNIPAESEKEAKDTALRYAPDDIPHNTYISYLSFTAKVISSKDI